MFYCVGFVYELDREYRSGISWRNGLFYSAVIQHRFFQVPMKTHDAYAPLPIVLETIRKGKSRGNGSSCDWNSSMLISKLFSIDRGVLIPFSQHSKLYALKLENHLPYPTNAKKTVEVRYPIILVVIACWFQVVVDAPVDAWSLVLKHRQPGRFSLVLRLIRWRRDPK